MINYHFKKLVIKITFLFVYAFAMISSTKADEKTIYVGYLISEDNFILSEIATMEVILNGIEDSKINEKTTIKSYLKNTNTVITIGNSNGELIEQRIEQQGEEHSIEEVFISDGIAKVIHQSIEDGRREDSFEIAKVLQGWKEQKMMSSMKNGESLTFEQVGIKGAKKNTAKCNGAKKINFPSGIARQLREVEYYDEDDKTFYYFDVSGSLEAIKIPIADFNLLFVRESGDILNRRTFIDSVALLSQSYDEILNTASTAAVRENIVNNVKYDQIPQELKPFFDNLIELCKSQREYEDMSSDINQDKEMVQERFFIDGVVGVTSRLIDSVYRMTNGQAPEIENAIFFGLDKYQAKKIIDRETDKNIKQAKYKLLDQTFEEQVKLKKTIDTYKQKYGYDVDSLLTYSVIQEINRNLTDYLISFPAAEQLLEKYPDSSLVKLIFFCSFFKNQKTEEHIKWVNPILITFLQRQSTITRYDFNQQQVALMLLQSSAEQTLVSSASKETFDSYLGNYELAKVLFAAKISPTLRFHRGFINSLLIAKNEKTISANSPLEDLKVGFKQDGSLIQLIRMIAMIHYIAHDSVTNSDSYIGDEAFFAFIKDCDLNSNLKTKYLIEGSHPYGETGISLLQKIMEPKFEWSIDYGFIGSDNIILVNKSCFTMTDPKLNVKITQDGKTTIEKTLEATTSIRPDETFTWENVFDLKKSEDNLRKATARLENWW